MPAAVPVRALSFHAGYACRRTGACCTSDWPVPVEAERADVIRIALAEGRLDVTAGEAGMALVAADSGTGRTGALLGRTAGQCVFFDAERPSCRVHSRLGHASLPLACRQFPRISVRDPRGVSLTLSHYCPTAAAMLARDDATVTIVQSPAGFPADGEYEGLDASMAMPPLLRPDMMMDWHAWWDFEARAVALLVAHRPAEGLARLDAIVERVRNWEPRVGPLGGAIAAAFDAAGSDAPAPASRDSNWAEGRIDEVQSAVSPGSLKSLAPLPAGSSDVPPPVSEATVSRFLAAHAFANWHIQLGQGLRTWLRSVEAAYAFLVAGHSIRQADLCLRHLADVNRLAKIWSDREN